MWRDGKETWSGGRAKEKLDGGQEEEENWNREVNIITSLIL